jgi:hypothetical protein
MSPSIEQIRTKLRAVKRWKASKGVNSSSDDLCRAADEMLDPDYEGRVEEPADNIPPQKEPDPMASYIPPICSDDREKYMTAPAFTCTGHYQLAPTLYGGDPNANYDHPPPNYDSTYTTPRLVQESYSQQWHTPQHTQRWPQLHSPSPPQNTGYDGADSPPSETIPSSTHYPPYNGYQTPPNIYPPPTWHYESSSAQNSENSYIHDAQRQGFTPDPMQRVSSAPVYNSMHTPNQGYWGQGPSAIPLSGMGQDATVGFVNAY